MVKKDIKSNRGDGNILKILVLSGKNEDHYNELIDNQLEEILKLMMNEFEKIIKKENFNLD